MAYVTSTRAARPSLADRLAAFANVLREAAQRRAIYVQTLRELSALSDRDLVDLGLTRGEIEAVAREAAYGL